MTSARWEEIKTHVGRALELPAGERAAYVARACGDDAVRREVESLLAAAGDEGDDRDSLPAARAAVAAEVRAIADAGDGRVLLPDADAELRALLERALGAQYEILRPLGRGGMGAVWLARERALERFVAIKVLRPDLAAAREVRERFRREARIAAQLVHPSIVPLYTFGEVGGVWYFVMGYRRGESLADRLRLEGQLGCDEARRILADLADALACAHRHGVVHRDIKPANVLLEDESGRALLADFGISKMRGIEDTLTATGMVVGTPHYMSPEQAAGERDVDERSDLYSLGVVGYTMLAGREPFAGVEPDALARRRATTDPTPLHLVAPDVSAELSAVIMRCLARDRALRWPDATSLRDALARADCEPGAALPEAVRDLPGFGPYALTWLVAWITIAALLLGTSGDRALLVLIALLVPVGLVLHVWHAGRHGLTPRELARVACWPPPWWGMWWPRALRRPGDLWTRLPGAARAVRVTLSGFFVALPALVLARRELGTPATDRWFDAAEVALLAIAAGVVLAGLRWAQRRELSLADAVHVLFGATVPSPGWRATRVAALLGAGTHEVRPPRREVPADYVRAIEELAPLLGAEVSAPGRAAARRARALRQEIAALDAELASLAGDAGAVDSDRLEAHLATLGDPAPDERDERRELRALLRGQLALVARIREQAEVAAARRAEAFDLLRGLWTHLRLVHAARAEGPTAAARAVVSLEALCAEASAVATVS